MSENLSERSIARVTEIYGRYAAGDREALYEALTPDAKWLSIGEGALPWAGEYRGREGVETYFSRLDAEAKVVDYEVEQVIAQGEWVAVLAWATVRYEATGCTHRYAKADFVKLDGDRVVEFREFYDTSQTCRDRVPS
ncbi:MAG: hypothetical protein JWR00_2930 [Rubritepida sp.]|nr:hypothetical protein [Rubritepida sp.]